MYDQRFYQWGLSGLASAADTNGWFLGHAGAAVLSMAFFIDDQAPPALRPVVSARLEDMIAANEAELSFAAVPWTADKPGLAPLLSMLDKNLAELSTEGHGVIYGALALRAIDRLGGCVPAGVLAGITRLLQHALTDNPERYWGCPDYKAEKIAPEHLVHFDSVEQAAQYCLANQIDVADNTTIAGNTYYFAGSKLHEITHAHALVVLKGLGHAELARKGLNNLSRQVFFTRRRPDTLPALAPRPQPLPLTEAFWQAPLKEYHHYKLAYSVYDLFATLDIGNREQLLREIAVHWR